MSSKTAHASATVRHPAPANPKFPSIGGQCDTLIKQMEVLHQLAQQLEDKISPFLNSGNGLTTGEDTKADETMSSVGASLCRIQVGLSALERRLLLLMDRVAI